MQTIHVERIEQASSLLAHIIESEAEKRASLRIGIPGGRGAKMVIEALLSLDDTLVSKVFLYLVDERLEGERNDPLLKDYGLGRAAGEGRFDLSRLIIPEKSMVLPEDFSFDLLFLGVGEDGHFASLFPSTYRMQENGAVLKEIHVSPKPPNRRVTFTFSAFAAYSRRQKVYLLCFGESKRDAFTRLVNEAGTETPETLPSLFFEQQGFDPVVMTDLAEPDGDEAGGE